MKMTPFFVDKVWGSKQLATLKNYKGNQLGETWEVANIDEGQSRCNGISVRQLMQGFGEIPFIIKLIGTSDYLSVQVHPNNEWAKKFESPTSLGKSECWLILDAAQDSGIYLGLKPGVTKEALLKKIVDSENVNDLLNFIPVKKGDFYFVPAGTVHAIGKNILLAEVQQASGITYRLWDWNRPEKRELHIEKGMQVINYKYELPAYQNTNGSGNCELVNFEKISVQIVAVDGDDEVCLDLGAYGKMGALLVLNGAIEISSEHESVTLNQYETVLLAAIFKDQNQNCISVTNIKKQMKESGREHSHLFFIKSN